MDIALLKVQLRLDEGESLQPYRDSVNKLTIGVGRNLTDRGISLVESDFLLTNDITVVQAELNRVMPWWAGVSENRQQVLANMAFNMGATRLLTFERFLAALQAGNYTDAAVEMLNSKWAKQVGQRAVRLAEMMEKG